MSMSIFMRHKFKFLLVLAIMGMALAGMMGGSHPVASQSEEAPAWVVRCNEGDSDRCEIFQRLVIHETGQRVAEFAIGFPEDSINARGVMILPLGILLPEGGQIQIDDHQPFKFKVRFCMQDGCFAYLNLNEQILDIMRKGKVARLTLKDLQGNDMNIEMSLKGFTKSLKDIS